jgi:hypothetical protein
MPHFHARAEFRRRGRRAPWVLAGVVIEGDLWPAVDGVEPLRQRLPEAGLVGWADLPTPILAVDVAAAAAIALEVARTAWPARVRPVVPYASGTPDRTS